MATLSKENYDSAGATSPLSGNQINYGAIRSHFGFGVTPKLSAFAQVDARALVPVSSNYSGNYGFGYASGLRWLIYRSQASRAYYPTECVYTMWILSGRHMALSKRCESTSSTCAYWQPEQSSDRDVASSLGHIEHFRPERFHRLYIPHRSLWARSSPGACAWISCR